MKQRTNVKLVVQLARKYPHMFSSGVHDAGIRSLRKHLQEIFEKKKNILENNSATINLLIRAED